MIQEHASEFGKYTTKRAIQLIGDLDRLVDGTVNSSNLVYQVYGSISDNETYTYKGIMVQPDFRDFVSAMELEIEDHRKRKHWVLCKQNDCGNPKTILAIWSFKRKQFPDGRLNKHKS